MKNIIKTTLLLTLAIIFNSCEKELEFGSNFEFQINNIDDSEIFINTNKTFQVEVISTTNINDNKNYKLSYQVVTGNIQLKDGTTTLIEGNQYDFELNDLNIIQLDLIPKQAGQNILKIILTDNNNVVKTKEVVILCTDEDYSFLFSGTVPNPTGDVNVGIPFSLTLANTGQSSNAFQLKYISTGIGNVIIGGNIKPANQYFNVTEGAIQGLYSSSAVGTQTITFTCIDSNAQTQQVSLTFNFEAQEFTLTKITDFTVKNTLKKDFKFTLTNTLPTATYQIKFTSTKPSKIFLGTNELQMNQWLNLTVIASNLYSYDYQALGDLNDVLTIEIKDSYNQVKSINYTVTVLSKPIIVNQNIQFTRSTPNYNQFGNSWSCVGNTRSNTLNTLSSGATLVKTKIIIKNKLTGAYDTLEFNNSNIQNTLETVSSVLKQTSNEAFTGCYNSSKYAGQLYTIQIQDSDGVWSDIYNGTVSVI